MPRAPSFRNADRAEGAPPDESSMIWEAGKTAMSPAMWVLDKLNIPQQAAFSAFAGDDAESLRGGKGYITGRQMLRHFGLAGQENTWGNAIAGTAVDVLADPLNLIGIGALTKAGRGAQKAGALARVGEALPSGVKAGAKLRPEIASRIAKGAAKTGRTVDQISDAEIAGRHLIRPRAAQRFGTISQLEDAAAAGGNVPHLDELRQWMSRMSPAEAARVAKMPLRKDIGIGLPFMDPLVKFNVPGGGFVADLHDGLVETLKYSPMGRHLRSAFDKNVSGAVDGLAQDLISGTRTLADDAARLGKREAAEQAAKLYGDDAARIFSETGNKELADLIERPRSMYDNVLGTVTERTGQVVNGLSGSKAVKNYIDWWGDKAKKELADSKALGLTAETLDDANVEGYLPRRTSPLLQRYAETSPGMRAALDTTTPDMLKRSEIAKVPGGRNSLAFVLSQDDRLVGPKRTVTSDEAAADIIGKTLFGDPSKNRQQSMELARLLHRLPEKDLNPAGLFGQHPTETITGYVEGRARARKTAESQLETLASYASKDGAAGERRAPVNEILQRMNLKSGNGYGAEQTLREMIAKKTGEAADNIRLNELTVPENLYNALQMPMPRMKEASPISQAATWWQSVWRNAILSWPSRYVRDLVGGLYSNIFVNAFSLRGLSLSWDMMAKGAFDESVAARIAKMPHYQGLSHGDAASRFYADLAATNLTTGGKRLDRGVAGEAVTEMFPGADQTGKGPLLQMLQEFGTTLKNTPNMLNTEGKFAISGAKVGDLSDTYNRLSGYTELMFQGYAPDAAADVMKKTHVDYSSLSEFEKELRNKYVPFYSFASRMLGEQARRIIEEPAKMNRTLDLLTAPQRYGEENDAAMPEYISEKFGFRMPSELMGMAGLQDRGGAKTYGYNFDFPGLEQLGLLRSAATLDHGDALERVGSQLHPFAKMAIENFSGTQMAPGRPPLEQKRGNIARIMQMEKPDEWVQTADRAVELIPGGARVGSLLRQLTEDGPTPTLGTVGKTLVNNLTGFKVKKVDRTDQLYNAINREQKALGGHMRYSRSGYVPKEAIPEMSAQDQRRVANMKGLQRAVRARQKLTKGMSNFGERD